MSTHRNGCTGCEHPENAYPSCWTPEQVSHDQDRMRQLVVGDQDGAVLEASGAEAREVISRHLVHVAVDAALSGGLIDWSDFPDIGEHDWTEVVRLTKEQADTFAAAEEQFMAAYSALAAQADREAS